MYQESVMNQESEVTNMCSDEEIDKTLENVRLAVFQKVRLLMKDIQNEREKILWLAGENEILLSETEVHQANTSRCEADIISSRMQFDRNCETCVTHKRNNEVLSQQLGELIQELNKQMQKERDDQKLYDENTSKYQEKWDEYFASYSKHPLFPHYEQAKRLHIEQGEYLKSAESQLRQLQAEIFKIKCERSRNEESKFYPMSKVIILIAEIKCKTTVFEEKVKEVYQDCSGLKAEINSLLSQKQLKKCFSEQNRNVNDSNQQTGSMQQQNFAQRTDLAIQNLLHFSTTPPPVQQKISVPRFNFFIPKLASVAPLSTDIRVSQPTNAANVTALSSPEPPSGRSPYRHHTSSEVAASEYKAEELEHKTSEKRVIPMKAGSRKDSVETFTFRAPFYIPQHTAKSSANVARTEGNASLGVGTRAISVRNYASGLEISAIPKSQPSLSKTFQGITYPQIPSEDAKVKQETVHLSPYFNDTRGTSLRAQTPGSDIGMFDQERTEMIREQSTTCELMSMVPCAHDIGKLSVDKAAKYRSFSPFDLEKHKQFLKEVKKSPEFDFTSRNMFAAESDDANNTASRSENPSYSATHEIMDSGMFCSSLFEAGPVAQKYAACYSESAAGSSETAGSEETPVQKLYDSPKATASKEKSLFSFSKTSEENTVRSAVFSLFGDADSETTSAGPSTSSFALNFGSSNEEKTEASSFKFLF